MLEALDVLDKLDNLVPLFFSKRISIKQLFEHLGRPQGAQCGVVQLEVGQHHVQHLVPLYAVEAEQMHVGKRHAR